MDHLLYVLPSVLYAKSAKKNTMNVLFQVFFVCLTVKIYFFEITFHQSKAVI